MSQPQQKKITTVTLSVFLEGVEKARATQDHGTSILCEHLKIVNDDNPASPQKPPDFTKLAFRYVDFSNLKAPEAVCKGSVALRCDFTGSIWPNAQDRFFISRSDVSDANFSGASGFIFYDSYSSVPAKGLTTEQARSIIPVSDETRWVLGTCNTKYFEHTIEQEKRLLELEEKLAALAEQVRQFSQR
ncbi:MAG: hypothetical protein ACK5WY_08350 [Holosporaceae bacterium]|jgi:hypothetical protein|nr:hypothetical protein [Rhodospirillaceae bacterium]